MSQNKSRRFLTTLILGVAINQAAVAQPGCEVFNNISHCPVNNAQLHLAADGSQLKVDNLGAGGNDGVVSQFDTATEWRAKLSVEGQADLLTFKAFLDGDVTAAASFDDSATATELRTQFTGGAEHHTFKAEIYNAGELVATFTDLDETSSISINRFPIPEPIPMPGPWPWPDFKRGPLGRCMWDFSFPETVSLASSSGGEAVGDRVRLVEDLTAGHYPYSGFSAITMQSNGSALTITDEQINN